MNEIATIDKDLLPIQRVIRGNESGLGDGRSWLEISIPNGWDDCKKLTKKVLIFNGETFVWRSWNSDRNVCYFIQSNEVATISKSKKRVKTVESVFYEHSLKKD